MKRLLLILSMVPGAFLCGYSQGTTSPGKPIPLKHGSHRIGKRTDSDMVKWRGYGLGQFIHWGLYSIPACEWNGKQYDGASEWIKSWNEVPKTTYDSLIYEFNPTKFDAGSWAATVKQMGVRYVTITTKHHDGFCLWPSKFTNFMVANSPYKKDMIGPLVKAYNKAGIDVILYFSVMDWHNPDWRYGIRTKDGNFVLNFGPKPDGTIRKEELDLAKEIGNWMNINGEAIYNCGHVGFDKQNWGYYTGSSANIDENYMLVFNVPVSGALRVKLPAGKAIQKAYLLGHPEATFKPEQIVGNEYFIHLKKTDYNKLFTIVLQTATAAKKAKEDKAKI
ncbi:alpha-L-fucosidase [Pedobacter borealis]|uniref:alpha-L-fucosidase n=1 Tax=Pedobacter borealis TaxID=475254 RepID=UPI000493520F|nr:alpha-L-fucosidase [Pedobacter borealis]